MSQPSEETNKALSSLQASTAGVKSTLLVGTDGSVLGSSASSPTERAQLSAVSAASVAIARKAVRNMGVGDLERVHLRGVTGSILLVRVGERAILAMVLADHTSPESVLNATRSAMQHIESLL